MNKPDIETEIQSKGKTAARITPDHIEGVIASEHYFTAASGVVGEAALLKAGIDYSEITESLKLLTFCVLVLKNGFTVTGESACASPENFNEEIGRKIARQNAVNKIWMLEGYLLKQKINDDECRNQMIEYIQQAIREGYESYYGLPENGIAWLSNECLKVDYGVAWEYYNLAADENGKHPIRALGE
nr:hypothetical protein [Providencia rettgeri]